MFYNFNYHIKLVPIVKYTAKNNFKKRKSILKFAPNKQITIIEEFYVEYDIQWQGYSSGELKSLNCNF